MMGLYTCSAIFKEYPEYGLFLKRCHSSVSSLCVLVFVLGSTHAESSLHQQLFCTNATVITSCLLSTFTSHAGLKIQDYLESSSERMALICAQTKVNTMSCCSN